MAIQALSPEEVYKYLQTTPSGLEEREALNRLRNFGSNEIIETARPSLIYTFIKHLTNLFALLLWGAAIIAFTGAGLKPGEGFLLLGLAITGVIFINGGFAFLQEYRAEKAFEALQKLLPFMVTVIREGKESEITASDLVPGDLVLLKEGNRVPADIRLIESAGIHVDNSSLTGESAPVKSTHTPQKDTELLDSANLVFAGTSVVTGSGRGVVFATGMSTEFGKIARLTSEVKSGMSPLELETARVTRTISIIAVSLGVVFFIIGIYIGRSFWENFIFALGIVVANIPEGLLPTVTLSLAMASQRMAKKKAIVRKLTSVETLGAVTVICTDKTGTLTQNKMSVVEIYTGGQHLLTKNDKNQEGVKDSRGQGVKGASEGSHLNPRILESLNPKLFPDEMFIRAISLCNDAHIRDGVIIGDPTENALLEFAQNFLDINTINSDEPRISTHPFDSSRKWMATLHRKDGKGFIYVKGAPETVLPLCSNVLINNEAVPFDDSKKKEAEQALNDMTAKALRVLAVAYREIENKSTSPGPPPLSPLPQGEGRYEGIPIISASLEEGKQQGVPIIPPPLTGGLQLFPSLSLPHLLGEAGGGEGEGESGLSEITNLTFIGFAGLEDPPRPEVPEAVRGCRNAGIKIIMITGDNPDTARAVGREIGLFNNPVIIRGSDLKGKSQKELMQILQEKEIAFARVAPEDKMTIVSALQDLGEVVAVTGDGVNDAPALKKADIGVAMGLSGTDVAKEASDIILMDDNFATIVMAVEEGRTVFENIKKFTTYILSSNIPEIIPYIAYALLGIPLPLTVIQILAVDLGTDMLPALALGTEPPESDILTRPPRSIKERLLSFPLLARAYLFLGPIEALASMAGFFWFLSISGWKLGTHLSPDNPVYLKATTVCLTGIIMTQIANVMVCRSRLNSVFSLSLKSNKLIFYGILTEIALLLLLVYTTTGNIIAGTSPIPLAAWLFFIPFSLLLLGMEEIRKLIMRKKIFG